MLRPYKMSVRTRIGESCSSEAKSRDECYTARRTSGSDLAKLERVYRRIDRHIVDEVEDVRGLQTQLEGARLFHGNGFAERHIDDDLAGAFDDIAAGVAEGRAVGIEAGVRRACRTRR